MIYLALYKAKGNWADWIIRKWTHSIYSHCEIVSCEMGQNPLTDYANWMTSSADDGGVRLQIFKPNPESWDFIPMAWVNVNDVRNFYNNTKGRKYSITELLFNQFFNFHFNSKNYVCHEWCAGAIGLEYGNTLNPGLLGSLVKYINYSCINK